MTSQISDKAPSSTAVSHDSEESEDDEGEDKILETGGGGRWQKNNQQVTRDVPGIDGAYLAMDTEEGVEVVWNEVIYSQNRKGQHKDRKERLKCILRGLTDMKHQNIVNFYDFWHDKVDNLDRLVFITEYITSGSLLQFLKKTKRTKMTNSVSEKIWRRWCRQILSALSYLHKNEIIHGNLSLASIFIQHNGLVKIGSVSPDAIHEHVKTKNVQTTTFHYKAPEYAKSSIKTSADIYAFGICALEMLDLDLIISNGEGHHHRVQGRLETMLRAVESIDIRKRDFIKLCLQDDPDMRPTAQDLLKQPVLQEVFNLKYLCTFALRDVIEIVESQLDEMYSNDDYEDQVALATIPSRGGKKKEFTVSQSEKVNIEKFFDEINQDFLVQETAQIPIYSPRKKDETGNRLAPQSVSLSTDRNSGLFFDAEKRKIVKILLVDILEDDEGKKVLDLKLQFEDKMERELKSEVKKTDVSDELTTDLVICGLISEDDRTQVMNAIEDKLKLIPWSGGE